MLRTLGHVFVAGALAAAVACDDITPVGTNQPRGADVTTPRDDDVRDDDDVGPTTPTAPACSSLPAANDPLLVQTTFATVRGFAHDEGGFAWKGIRFAAPPTAAPAC